MSITIVLDHRSVLGPVRDQGARPTCLSFAATAAHEHVRRSGAPLSPEYLHYFASDKGSSDGVVFPDIVGALEGPGQPSEVDCPYHPDGLPSGWLPPNCVSVYRRRSDLKYPEPDEIEALLSTEHVPVLGISTPHTFYSPAPPWLLSPDGLIRGLHAVTAVALGTTGSMRCFLIRNSWGTAWGDEGHAWIDDAFVNQHLRHLLALTEEVT